MPRSSKKKVRKSVKVKVLVSFTFFPDLIYSSSGNLHASHQIWQDCACSKGVGKQLQLVQCDTIQRTYSQNRWLSMVWHPAHFSGSRLCCPSLKQYRHTVAEPSALTQCYADCDPTQFPWFPLHWDKMIYSRESSEDSQFSWLWSQFFFKNTALPPRVG